MKKLLLLVISIILLSSTSCTLVDDTTVTVIAPSGTPSLALAKFASENEGKMEIVAGGDPLLASMLKGSHDIVVAPVNLGAKVYQTNKGYSLYKTFVWGNLFIASKKPITSLNDLNNQSLVCFGKNSTPDIVLQTILLNHPELSVEVTYVSDVSEANTLLATGKADYVVSAEPSLSKLKTKLGLHILDLQKEWSTITGDASYPQAGIFVKRAVIDQKEVKSVLNQLTNAVKFAIENPEENAKKAVTIHTSFQTLGVEVLTSAIPNCNYKLLESDKEAVLFYFQQMIDLGFGKQIGGILPDDEFFI